MIQDIILDALLSGATGYATNKHVIDSLYKEYSITKRFKFGGAIMNSKEQLVDNIAAMMEKNIVNAEKISQNFSDHNLTDEFKSFSQHFMDECLFRDIKNVRLKDISSFYDISYCVKDMIIGLIRTNMSNIVGCISQNIGLNEIISDKQAEYIARTIVDNLLMTIKNTNMIELVLSDVYDDFCDYKITDFASKDIFEKIKTNIVKESTRVPDILKKEIDEKLDDFCHDILKSVDLKGSIINTVDYILDKPLRSLIVVPLHEIKQKAFNSILFFINSENGEKAIKDLYYDLIEYCDNNKITLFNICTDEYQEAIKKYTEERLNSLVYSTMQWLEHNSVQIDQMISYAVDDIISIKSPIGKKIYNTIMTYYLDNRYGDKSSISGILFELAKSSDNIEKISTYITDKVTNYLKSSTLKNIIDNLEDKRVINSNIFYNIVLNKFKEIGVSIVSTEIDSIVAKPIRQYISINADRLASDGKIEYLLIDYIKENTFFSKEACQAVTQLVNEYMSDSIGKKLGEVCDSASASEIMSDIKYQLIDDINENRSRLEEGLGAYIKNNMQSSSIQELLDLTSESGDTISNELIKKATEYIVKNFSTAIDNIGDIRVSKIISTINKPALHMGLSNFMKDVVGESIATITDGYINQSVQKHFEDLSKDEFIEFIKQTNLVDNKGICFGGGVTSLVASLPFSVASTCIFNHGLISGTFSWQGAILCSLLGISTNIVAMNRFSDITITNSILKKIPLFSNCTDDFIKEKQRVFAAYMANVIENNLIDVDTVQDVIQSKSTKIKETLFYSLKYNDSEKIFKCLKENKEYTANAMTNGTRILLKNHKESLINFIARSIADTPIRYLFNRDSVDFIGEKISSDKKVIEHIDSYIVHSLGEKNVSQLIPHRIEQGIKDDIELAIEDSYLNNIEFIKSMVSFKRYIVKKNKQYKDIMAKPVVSLFSNDAVDDCEANIFNVAYEAYFSKDKINKFTVLLYDLLNNECINDKLLDDVIDRRSKVFLSGMLYKYFNDIVFGLSNYLSENLQENLVDDIIQKVVGNLNLKEKESYNAMGGDILVEKILNNLVVYDLPKFINNNFEQFYDISKNLLKGMYEFKISQFDIQIDKELINKLLSNMIINGSDSISFISNKLYLTFRLYTKKYKEQEFEHIAKLFNINTINGVCGTYGGPISDILKNIYGSIKKDKVLIVSKVNTIIDDIYKYVYGNVKVKEILSGLPKDSVQSSVEFIKKVSKDKELVLLGVKNVLNAYYNYLEDIDLLDTMIDINELKSQLEKIYDRYIASNDFDRFGLMLYSKIIDSDLQDSMSYYLSGNVKKYLLDLLVDGLYLVIKRDLVSLFKCIELDKLTEKEILKLEPKKFQKIFKVIWKNNQKAMYITGAGGALFGFNKYVAETVSLTGIIRSLKSFIERKRAEIKAKKIQNEQEKQDNQESKDKQANKDSKVDNVNN